MTHLHNAAVAVLNGNWTGTATLPSRTQYPHQWSWDSAFISIGWAHCAPERARQELAALFTGQWGSGRVPQIVFNPEADPGAYFPGPDFWRSHTIPEAPETATSGIVQPPVHARAVLTTYLANPSADSRRFLAALYPRLCAWHGYLHRHRNAGGAGLAAIVHPWESGLDNSPAWDHAIGDESDEDIPFARRDMIHIPPRQRPTDADYRSYLALARNYRDTGYGDGEWHRHRFVVEDPLFNAVFLDAERCCASIARILGRDPTPHERAARGLHDALVSRLWHSTAGRFAARDVHTGRLSATATVGSLVPLLDPWLPAEIADAVVTLASSPDFAGGCVFPLPSTALHSPHFDPQRYWRGPTWINTNWLVWVGAQQAGHSTLAKQVSDASLALIEQHGFREYYDPLTGAGLGADHFSWTAALALDFLAGGEP